MPIAADLVGTTSEAVTHAVDSRWLMAYAASVGAFGPAYLDTTRPDGIVAHPVFPVALEWPAVLAMRDRFAAGGLERDEAARGVHLTHDLEIHRPVRPGDHLATTAQVTSISAHRSGTLVVLRLDTLDSEGRPVATSAMGTLYRGVTTTGEVAPAPTAGTPAPQPPPAADDGGAVAFAIDLGGDAAHVYTECSRIWNPIHTDARTAARAGLPGIVLHGTATLARAVTGLVERVADDDPTLVTAVACRFGAIVTLPSRLALDGRLTGRGDEVAFTVNGPAGEPVLRHGRLRLRRPG